MGKESGGYFIEILNTIWMFYQYLVILKKIKNEKYFNISR